MRRFVSVVLVIATLMSLCSLCVTAAEERGGAVFEVDELYRSKSPLPEVPRTFESWVKVEKGAASSELGVICGNYKNSTTPSYGMEVRENGNPFIWWGYGGNGTNQRISFDKVDLRTGEWTFVSITCTPTSASCYINGELRQTMSIDAKDLPMAQTGSLCIGGDLRSGNKRYLKSSTVSSVAVFSDIRTADEIKADMAKVDLADPALLVCYDLSPADTTRLKDLSPKGNDLTYSGKLLETPSEDTEKGGMTFNTDAYKLVKKIDVAIKTLETTVYFPKSMPISERGGVIIGNYNSNLPCVNFEVYSDGSPRVYIKDSSNTTYNYVFDKINVYNGEWTHIAVVKESASTLSCYINGELKQTITKASPDVITTDVHVLGGDQRSGNSQYFKGRIKNVALYSDARTADEIKSDVTAPAKDGLICSFELEGQNGASLIEDKSGNGYNAKLNSHYFTDKAPLDDYAYSFAVIGDTQILAVTYPEKFTALYDWVLGNVESKKIKLVLGLGDITDDNTTAEWELARRNITRMNGVVPYSLVRGNHDGAANMNKYFPISEYKDVLGGVYLQNTIINSWQELVVGETKYLIFTLDYGANDAILNWADKIIAAHPEHNVIITTHAYLFRDGTTLDAGDVVPPSNKGATYNNGDHMWDKLIKKHENIVLVLSGHDPCDNVVATQTKGDHGNVVTQMLVDPQGVDKAQGGVGMVTMLYFSEDGKTMQVETYSTDRKAFYLEENQFTLTIDLVDVKAEETTKAMPDSEETTAEQTAGNETTAGADITIAPEDTDAPEAEGCGSLLSLAIIPLICLFVAVVGKKRS